MAGVVERLERFLEAESIEYEVIHHPRDFTAARAAADTHSPADAFAKPVLLDVDGRIVMAVLPASLSVAPRRVAGELMAREVRLADEEETGRLFPDCELGAEPPFGNLYGLDVYVSPSLSASEEITFNAGSHDHAVRMRYADWERIVLPRSLRISNRDR